MSFHQWLSGTPKFHLTSSAADELAAKHTKNASSCQQLVADTTTNTYGQGDFYPTPQPSLSHHGQASMMDYEDFTLLGDDMDMSEDFVDQASLYHPLTPMSLGYDTPPDNDSMLPTYPDTAFDGSQTGPGCNGPTQPACTSSVKQATVAFAPTSRDRESSRKQQPTAAAPKKRRKRCQSIIPSPPQTPSKPGITHSTPPKEPRRGTAQTHPASPARFPRSPYTDPMLQTSSDPHFWARTGTVLKADTNIGIGNVISPTCMAGLPFGGMIEMTLPLPPGGIKGVSDFV